MRDWRPPRAARQHRPLSLPPAGPPGHRAPIPWAAIRAAWGAHAHLQHDGRYGLVCPTCDRYLAALKAAPATQPQEDPTP